MSSAFHVPPLLVRSTRRSGSSKDGAFEVVQIVDGKAYLDVSVWTSDTNTNQNRSVATNGVIEVLAPGKQGVCILQSKGVPPDVSHAPITVLGCVDD